MARVGLTGLLGAGAAGAYGMHSVSGNTGMPNMWSHVLPGNWMQQGANSGSASQEVTALQRELQRLTGVVGDMARSGRQPTVVHVGGSRSGSWALYVVPAVAGGVLYVYCRITGTSIWDMLYVSRSSLTAFKSSMQDGMSKLKDEVTRQTAELFRAVGLLGSKQEELKGQQTALMSKQHEMDDRLKKVDAACDQLDSKADHTINRVEVLDHRLQDVHTGVQAANQGIYMLVSAVSEVTQKIGLHNSRTAQALKTYLHGGPTWQSGAGQQVLAQGSLPLALPDEPARPAALPAPARDRATLTPSLSAMPSATVGGLRSLVDTVASSTSLSASASLPAVDQQPQTVAGGDGGKGGARGTAGPSCVIQELSSGGSGALGLSGAASRAAPPRRPHLLGLFG